MKNKAALVFAIVAGVVAFVFFGPLLGMSMIISLIIGIVFAGLGWFVGGKLTEPGKGHWSAKETCAICGKEVGLNRFRVGKTTSGKIIWKCPECAKKGGLININYETGKATFIDNKDTETRMKCNACGHVYCYTFEDLQRNEKLAKSAVVDSLIGVGEAVGGTRIGSQVATAKADSKMNQIVDYTKCPHCHSADVKALTKEEWEIESAKRTQTAPISSADELKKFKELLDAGVITQEEFDAKKKQLLGL